MKQLPLPFPPDTVDIPVSKTGNKHAGKVVTVSYVDKDLCDNNWYIDAGYATRRHTVNGKQKQIRMHRVILERMIGRDIQTGEFPDHIDGNPLNNSRDNLRLVTRAQNNQNSRMRKDNTSGCKGVNLNKTTNKWQVVIMANKKSHRLGSYDDYDEACRVANEFRERLHGEYARVA
jgi:hypothetical protein